MNRGSIILTLLVAGILLVACSGGTSSPVMPGMTGSDTPFTTNNSQASDSKALWGFWEISIDTLTWEAEIVPLRGPEFTVDVVTFLQPPAGNPANLSIKVTDVSNWFDQGLIGVDVGLKHPFPGLDQYTGFDVYGVFMAPGSMAGQYDSDVAWTNGDDEPILRNADGYTRWMNPIEFAPDGTILAFVPGKLSGSPLELFTSTINGYKYFADDLDKDQDVGEFFTDTDNVDERGAFKPGSFNERSYDLKFAIVDEVPMLIFQYAVVASWVEADMELSGDPEVLDVPGDFPLSANADEAFFIQTVDDSSLYFVDDVGGGAISFELEVFDWGSLANDSSVPDQIGKIVVEAGGVIPGDFVEFDQASLLLSAAPGTTGISSVFQIDIANCTPDSIDDLPLLITIESSEPVAFDPGTGIPANDDVLAGYFFHSAPVGDDIPSQIVVTSPNGGETLWQAMSHEITWDPGPGSVTDVIIEWSTDNFVSEIFTIIDSTENDGSYLWAPIPVVDTTTARVRVSDAGSGTDSDTSDADFTIALPVWLDFMTELKVDPTSVNWMSWPTYNYTGEELSPAIGQDTDGMVHIIYYNNRVGGGDDVHVRSMNGTSWSGQGNEAGTGGGSYPQRLDSCKVAPDINGHSWSFGFSNYWWSYARMHMWDVDRLWGGNTGFSFGIMNIYTNNINHTHSFGELGSDSQGRLYIFGDYQTPGVIYLRKSAPNNGHSWGSYQQLTSSGYVSHTRSVARQDTGMALIYIDGTDQLILAETTDAPTNDTWDTSEVVWDATDYSNTKCPSLNADSSERLFAAWTAQNTSGDWDILASMRETASDPWTTPALVTTSTSEFHDIHIHSAQVDLPSGTTEDVAVVTWETGDEVHSALSPLDVMAFLPSQMVSTTGDEVRDPDGMCINDSFGYVNDVLFTYSWNNSSNWDIALRNADFDTP